MVVQKTIDNLKDKPREEKTAIAGSVAVAVVVLLLVGWGFWFLKKVQRGEQFDTFMSTSQDQFNPEGVREAQEQFQKELLQTQDQLRKLRDVAVPPGTPEYQPSPPSSGTNGFGSPDESAP